jgi:hypothetical protein
MTAQIQTVEPTKQVSKKAVEKADKSNQMSTADYDRRRAEIEKSLDDAHDRFEQDNARYEQELSKLFIASGWTQEKLAKKEGMSQPYTSQLLRFGRFMEYCNCNISITPFNEGRFRDYWFQTGRELKDENARFQQVLDIVEGKMKPIKPKKKKQSQPRAVPAEASEDEADTVTTECGYTATVELNHTKTVNGLLKEMAEVITNVDPVIFVKQCSPRQHESLPDHVDIISKWLARVTEELERTD